MTDSHLAARPRSAERTVADRRARKAALVVLTLLAALLAGCGGSTRSTAGCRVGAQLVPTCGALLGVTPAHPDLTSLRASEAAAGTRFGMVYSFHDINDTIPSAYDRAVVRRGQLLHVDIDARDYASQDRFSVTWAAVAAGAYDHDLVQQARGIASLHVPVFVTFDHEADQPARSAQGTPADYVAAWRHVHQVFADNGATNAVWVWVMLGWPPSFPTALQMWPGNTYVDWISWDAYNASGCRSGAVDEAQMQTFGDVALPFLTWIEQHGPAAGIDVHKPMMISETGTVSYPSDPGATATWLRGLTQVVQDHPQIKAVSLWDHVGSDPGCDFRLSDDPSGAQALSTLSTGGWVDPTARAVRSPSGSAG